MRGPGCPLAGLGSGHGGGRAGTGLVEPFELEQAGFEALFEGGERGGRHGRGLYFGPPTASGARSRLCG